jgi:hypothetical protein
MISGRLKTVFSRLKTGLRPREQDERAAFMFQITAAQRRI